MALQATWPTWLERLAIWGCGGSSALSRRSLSAARPPLSQAICRKLHWTLARVGAPHLQEAAALVLHGQILPPPPCAVRDRPTQQRAHSHHPHDPRSRSQPRAVPPARSRNQPSRRHPRLSIVHPWLRPRLQRRLRLQRCACKHPRGGRPGGPCAPPPRQHEAARQRPAIGAPCGAMQVRRANPPSGVPGRQGRGAGSGAEGGARRTA